MTRDHFRIEKVSRKPLSKLRSSESMGGIGFKILSREFRIGPVIICT